MEKTYVVTLENGATATIESVTANQLVLYSKTENGDIQEREYRNIKGIHIIEDESPEGCEPDQAWL